MPPLWTAGLFLRPGTLEAKMRKNASFTVAALALLALAVILLAVAPGNETVADALRPRAGTAPQFAPVSAFLPVKRLEPAW